MANDQQTGVMAALRQNKERLRRAAMLALAVLFIGAVLLSAFSIRNERLRDKVIFSYVGILHDDVNPIAQDKAAQKESLKQTKRHGQIGKFRYYCKSYVQLRAYFTDAAIYFGNIESNDCALVFCIMDPDGNLLYRSGGVEPGNYVARIRLSTPMPDGLYACKVYVSAYDLETNAYLGTQYSDLTLEIGG